LYHCLSPYLPSCLTAVDATRSGYISSALTIRQTLPYSLLDTLLYQHKPLPERLDAAQIHLLASFFMTTLFDNTGLPLWVYIVLIVVGSTLLLVIVALLLRWWYLRRRRVPHRGLDNLTGATRRVTLRRGRVVPTSQHLSLTGSKFGVRQFGLLGDNESAMTGRRSPFEWWNTIMAERSHSRLDQMSQIETGSLMSRSASRGTTRRELRSTTPNQTPEKNKEAASSTWEVTPPSPSLSPSPSTRRTTVNFSRAFLSQTPSSPLTQRSQHTLSRISERSPHQSMISMNPRESLTTRYSHQAALNPLDSTPRHGHAQSSPTTARRPSHLALPSSNVPSTPRSPTFSAYRSSPLSTPPLAQDADTFRTSATLMRPITSTQTAIPPRPRTADAATSRRFDLLPTRQHAVLTPDIPAPKPVVYPAFNSISGRQPQPFLYRQPSKSQPDLTTRRSVVYTARGDNGTPSPSTPNSTSAVGPSGVVYDSQVSSYWPTPLDVQDLSSTLGYDDYKGSNHADRTTRGGERESIMGIVTVPGKHDTRVLRKKSLKRLPKATSMAV